MAAEAARLDTRLVRPVAGATLRQRALRPRFSALGSARGQIMPTLQSGLDRYMAEAVSEALEAARMAPQADAVAEPAL
jgi:dTDP-4-dehydrorhamnose reductase